jgi:hypothetical protein
MPEQSANPHQVIRSIHKDAAEWSFCFSKAPGIANLVANRFVGILFREIKL